MRLPEQKVWDTMKRHAPVGAWAQRIENLVGVGMPDVYIPSGIWVELKAPHQPVRLDTPLLGSKEGLNTDQINWHLKATLAGDRTFVLIRTVNTKGLYLVSGGNATGINKWPAAKMALASLADNWEGIWEVILEN